MIQSECDAKLLGSSNGKAWLKALCCLLALVTTFLVVAFLSMERFGLEKVLTGFAMPVGLGWLLLTYSAVFSWLNGASRISRYSHAVAWLLLSLVSTSPLPDLVMRALESQITAEFRPNVDEELAVLIVFGGGTHLGPHRAEAAEAGDRVLYAAQLYLQGHAKRLVTTGNRACEETLQIWRQLGIPETDIQMLPGANTFQEIQNLKPILELAQHQRIGILSSAYHLPRIQRLASKAGIDELISVAANHRSGNSSYDLLDFVPSATALDKFSDGLKEWLGRMVGR